MRRPNLWRMLRCDLLTGRLCNKVNLADLHPREWERLLMEGEFLHKVCLRLECHLRAECLREEDRAASSLMKV